MGKKRRLRTGEPDYMKGRTVTGSDADRHLVRQGLEGSSLADGLTADQIDRLSELGELRRYAAGEIIVRQYDSGDNLMVLTSGHAEISTFLDEPLYYVRPGMAFGEIALIDERPRSATVRAQEPSEVIVLPGLALRELLESEPALGLVVMRNLAKVLCGRVRAANQQIAALLTLEELHEHGA